MIYYYYCVGHWLRKNFVRFGQADDSFYVYMLTCYFPDSLFFFLKNGGIVIMTLYGVNKYCTLKPLLAIMESPGSQIWGNWLLSAICLSLVEAPYAGDTYEDYQVYIQPKLSQYFCSCMLKMLLAGHWLLRLHYWTFYHSLHQRQHWSSRIIAGVGVGCGSFN